MRHPPPAKGDAPGQQVRLHRVAGPGRVEPVGDLLGIPEQRSRMLAECVPGLGENEAGPRLPVGPTVGPEHPPRLSRPLSGAGWVARGQGGGGGRVEQLRVPVRYAPAGRNPAQRGVGLLCRFSRQAGGQQRQATVDGEFGNVLAERLVASSRFVEIRERVGEVAAG